MASRKENRQRKQRGRVGLPGGFWVPLTLLGLLGVVVLSPLWAGTTGIVGLFDPQGGDSPRASGDYIVSGTGLNTFYRYYAEVPQSLSRLVVELYDADIGLDANDETENRDRGRDAGFTSTNEYRLLDPDGVVRAVVQSNDGVATDDAWSTLFDSNTAPVFVGVGGPTTVNTGTSVNVPIPAGDAGDRLLAIIALNLTTSNPGTPAGWTLVDEGNCSSNCRLEVYTRVAVAGDAAVTISWTGAAKGIGHVLRYTPSVGTPTSGSATGTGTTATAPSVTNLANSRVVRLMVAGDDNLTTTSPGTERYDNSLGGPGVDVTSAAGDATVAAAGTTGTGAFTGLDVSTTWRAVTVAFANSTVTNGHWELQVDPTTGTGDDLNALGMRAHDGTSGSGGTEIPMYYDSHTQYGTNDDAGAPSTRAYQVYPWITSGCTFGSSDFDFDSATPTGAGPAGAEHGRIDMVRPNSTTLDDVPGTDNVFPTPTVAQQSFASSTLSTNDAWASHTINRWTDDLNSVHYGIWRADIQISEYTANSNYSNVYFYNAGSAGGAPAANPTSGAFRVYLQSDALGAPFKPYLELLMRAIGPAPAPTPAVGVGRDYTVTARVVNPTGQAITFSTSSNVVTVPLSGSTKIAYIGSSAAASQGSIVSQPAANATTGDVVWNPGTLAAQSVADASFRVRITPTVAGERILATAAPTFPSTGTRAQYVDETGNTSQARATYQLGPICEVAVTVGVATRSLVGDVRAIEGGARYPMIEWTTSTEDGAVAFRLHRLTADRRWEPVGEWVGADAKASRGGVYRVEDPSLRPGQSATYSVVEVDRQGKSSSYGPFLLTLAADASVERDALPGRAAIEPAARDRSRAAKAARELHAVRQAVAEDAAPEFGLGRGVAKVVVGASGLVRLSAADLGPALGQTAEQIAKRITKGGVRVETEGQSVSTYAMKGGEGLSFYAAPHRDQFGSSSIYWVRLAEGQAMRVDGTAAAAPTATSYREQLTLEQDAFAVLVLPSLGPDSDYWFWDAIEAGGASKRFPVTLPGATGAVDGELRVRLRGAVTYGLPVEHEVEVRFNGESLGMASFSGTGEHLATLALPAKLVAGGAGEIELVSRSLPGVPYSAQFIDGFEVAYDRRHQAVADRLEFDSTPGQSITVAGFSEPGIALLDISDPTRPRLVNGAAITETKADGVTVSYEAGAAPRRWLATTWNAAQAPISFAPSSVSEWTRTRGAEYLVIAPREFLAEAGSLAAYRAGQGLSTLVVSLNEIYDDFAFGYQRPDAVRDFLRYATSAWRVRPRYVALVGEGTYDYTDHMGLGGNLFPARMVSTPDGLAASDASYGDLDGDGVADLAIGRIPVAAPSELTSYLTRLQAVEAAGSAAPFRGRLLLASDNGGNGADFKPQAESFAAHLTSPLDVRAVHLSTMSLQAARSALLQELSQGAGMFVYYGHAGLDRLADEALLSSADVPAIQNLGRAPFFAALTCSLNRFELPGFSSLGEELVRGTGGGSVAVWSPSGWSITSDVNPLGDVLAAALYRSTTQRVGDLLLQAGRSYVVNGGSASMLGRYHLLGDPALRLTAPTLVGPSNPPTQGE